MSKIFYDHLVALDEVEAELDKIVQSSEEREELWQIVDELIHHKVLGCILDKLPQENHQEFLEIFHKAPYDEELIRYLKERLGKNTEELIRQEIKNLTDEIFYCISLAKATISNRG